MEESVLTDVSSDQLLRIAICNLCVHNSGPGAIHILYKSEAIGKMRNSVILRFTNGPKVMMSHAKTPSV